MLSPFRYWPDEAGKGELREAARSLLDGYTTPSADDRRTKKTRDISSILHVQANVRF